MKRLILAGNEKLFDRLKLLINEEICYLVWDSDTVPLKKVTVMENGKPVFHLKSEIHEPYFRTLKAILPDCPKQIKKSFIAEHMLINCEVMEELIRKIEGNRVRFGIGEMQAVMDIYHILVHAMQICIRIVWEKLHGKG